MTALTRFSRLSATALALTLCVPALPAHAQDTAFQTPADFTQMVEEKLPAVVGILSTGPAPQAQPAPAPQLPPGLRDFFGAPGRQQAPARPMQSQGSGFIISADGYVVTNNHVIANGEEIEVVLSDDRRFDAELIGTDPATDIALLKIEANSDLPHVDWGSSQDLAIGEWVVAIGNPFGLGGTVTAGIVSARSRDINSGPYDDFIQTDAAINRGNSGGPLFNAPGEVVGVNTAIFSPTGGSVGIGFAVPSHVAQRIVDDLREDGEVERGWLGVNIQPVTEELAEALDLSSATGVLVTNVSPGGPAADAGLQAGDVITEIAGTGVDEPRALTFTVADLAVGNEVTVTYLRDGERAETTVTIGQRPDMMAAAAPAQAPAEEDASESARIGVAVAPVTAQLREQLRLPPEMEGIAIAEVTPDSPAAEAGIRPGDVILQAGGTQITDAEGLKSAAAAAREAGKPLLLRVFSRGSYTYRAVKFDSETAGN